MHLYFFILIGISYALAKNNKEFNRLAEATQQASAAACTSFI